MSPYQLNPKFSNYMCGRCGRRTQCIPLRAHFGGMSRVTQAVSMEVPFWRVQRLSQGDELDGPSKDTARTLRNLLVSFESQCQASRLKCALTAAEADETGNGLLVNAAVSPSQRRSPPMPGPRRDNRTSRASPPCCAETCKNEGWGPCVMLQASTGASADGPA